MSQDTFRIEIDSNTVVTHQIVKFKGREYPVSTITGITFSESKQSLNFITTNHIRSLEIAFGDTKIHIWSQSPILRKSKFQNILNAFQAISSITFQQRLKHHIDQFTTQGYFDYDRVRIYENGIIENLKKPTERVSLCGAFTQNRVNLGVDLGVSWIGFSASDPTTVAVFDEKPKMISSPKKAVAFTCRENRDVIMSILRFFDKSS